jgi:3-phosphoshikimate 1-carboxyvinyltransferase
VPTGVPDVVRIHPAPLSGRVRVPGDKSVSHRALLLSALVGERTRVVGLAPSGDVASSAAALRTLGAAVELGPGADGQLDGAVTGPLGEAGEVLDCGNSGTSLRLLAGIAAGIDGLTVLTGDASLRRRPVARVREPLVAMGARVDARAGGTLPPVVIRGGGLHGIRHDSPVASAQVKSCVLLAGLAAEGETVVASPRPSRDHTERMLRAMGADVELDADRPGEVVRLRPGRPLRSVGTIEVPGDPSSAAFWLVAASVGEGAIEVADVLVNPRRDGVVRALAELGASPALVGARDVSGEQVGTYRASPGELGGATLGGDLVVDAIDELPVLALAGAMSRDGLEVRDAAELRVKESDRIATTARALGALGIEVDERPDGYRVGGGQRPGPGRVEAHGDHRIAMTAAIAGTVGTGPVEVSGFAAVATSYPSFLDDLRHLGGRAEVLATV